MTSLSRVSLPFFLLLRLRSDIKSRGNSLKEYIDGSDLHRHEAQARAQPI